MNLFEEKKWASAKKNMVSELKWRSEKRPFAVMKNKTVNMKFFVQISDTFLSRSFKKFWDHAFR